MNTAHTQYYEWMCMSAVLKDVETSPVVTDKMSAQGITLTRQSLDESSSAYLCYNRVISVIEGYRSFNKEILPMKIFTHREYILIEYQSFL